MSTHGNPPRRPPTAGGSASRPTAPPAGGRPAPAGRPAPVRSAAPPRPAAPAPEELDDDAKTQAFNIADMGLDDDEKTAAFNIDDLPLDDAPPARQPQRTLVGHPVSPKGARPAPARSAPVRSAPVRSGAAAPAPAEASPDEATMAMDMSDMLAAVDGDDDGDEKTAAISLDEIQAMNAVSARPRGKAAEAADLIGANDKTLAMHLDKPIEELAAAAAPPRAAASKASKGAASRAGSQSASAGEVPSADGFMGSISYFFQSGSIRARVERGELPKSAYDEAAAKKGLINAAMVGGGVLALTLVAGLLA